MPQPRHIAVIGLGYVGLPLAVALARHYPVTGFDINAQRVAELGEGQDRTAEVDAARLRASTLRLTTSAAEMAGAGVFIVTVPTPVDARNNPDLGAVLAACRTVGAVMSQGAIVVFESTVYPGVTENLCGPELEKASGLVCGRDFFLGYSPERINPGDREHTVDRITKVVAGQNAEVTRILAELYGRTTTGGVFIAADIKTAEAAKAIENAQRDINIAFINEVTVIFNRLGISVHDVLDASATKWNFLNFKPGLVGGHCIGVDPYYLAHCALEAGHEPEIILAGRRINDRMGAYIADRIAKKLTGLRDGNSRTRVLVLGLTFKENVSDLRNSKVIDIITGLRSYGFAVDVHDPLADPVEAKAVYGIDLHPSLQGMHDYDCVVGAVAHASYAGFTAENFAELVRAGGLVADVKGMWRGRALPESLLRWQL